MPPHFLNLLAPKRCTRYCDTEWSQLLAWATVRPPSLHLFTDSFFYILATSYVILECYSAIYFFQWQFLGELHIHFRRYIFLSFCRDKAKRWLTPWITQAPYVRTRRAAADDHRCVWLQIGIISENACLPAERHVSCTCELRERCTKNEICVLRPLPCVWC